MSNSGILITQEIVITINFNSTNLINNPQANEINIYVTFIVTTISDEEEGPSSLTRNQRKTAQPANYALIHEISHKLVESYITNKEKIQMQNIKENNSIPLLNENFSIYKLHTNHEMNINLLSLTLLVKQKYKFTYITSKTKVEIHNLKGK